MKIEKKVVSRNVETISGTVNKEKEVEFQAAESVEEMLSLTEGNLEKALGYFNGGRWAEIRTNTSNELAGGTPEEKAFARVVKAVQKLPMFANRSEEQVISALRENPALMSLFGGQAAA